MLNGPYSRGERGGGQNEAEGSMKTILIQRFIGEKKEITYYKIRDIYYIEEKIIGQLKRILRKYGSKIKFNIVENQV